MCAMWGHAKHRRKASRATQTQPQPRPTAAARSSSFTTTVFMPSVLVFVLVIVLVVGQTMLQSSAMHCAVPCALSVFKTTQMPTSFVSHTNLCTLCHDWFRSATSPSYSSTSAGCDSGRCSCSASKADSRFHATASRCAAPDQSCPLPHEAPARTAHETLLWLCSASTQPLSCPHHTVAAFAFAAGG